MMPADLNSITPNLLQAFGTRNALLSAGDADRGYNTMTIGWCQLGRLWNAPVCTVYVRPERFTYHLIEETGCFSVSVLPENMKSVMAFCGSKSGRDFDKIKESGLTLSTSESGAPYFQEAELVLVCKKFYVQDLDPAGVLDAGAETILPFYGEAGGWHRAYTGKIIEAYTK